MLDPSLTFEDSQSWNSGLVRPAGIKTSFLLSPWRAFVLLRPSLSSHTTQRQRLSLQGPLTQCHLPVLPLSLSVPLRTQPLPHVTHFLRRRSLEAPCCCTPPSVSASLCVMVTLKRTAWLIYALSAVMFTSLQTSEQCAKTIPASQGCFSQVFCHHKGRLSDTPCLQPTLLPALNFLIIRVSPSTSGDLEGEKAKVQIK